jgi:hypothetical protein
MGALKKKFFFKLSKPSSPASKEILSVKEYAEGVKVDSLRLKEMKVPHK